MCTLTCRSCTQFPSPRRHQEIAARLWSGNVLVWTLFQLIHQLQSIRINLIRAWDALFALSTGITKKKLCFDSLCFSRTSICINLCDDLVTVKSTGSSSTSQSFAGKLCIVSIFPPVLILKKGSLCLSFDLHPDLGLVHYSVGKDARLPVLCVSFSLLGFCRCVLPGAAQGQDPAGHGRGRSKILAHTQLRHSWIMWHISFAAHARTMRHLNRSWMIWIAQKAKGMDNPFEPKMQMLNPMNPKHNVQQYIISSKV